MSGEGPGWDAKAIGDIANTRYDGYAGLFEAHGWPERSSRMMPAVQRHVGDAYGSVEAFANAQHPKPAR